MVGEPRIEESSFLETSRLFVGPTLDAIQLLLIGVTISPPAEPVLGLLECVSTDQEV